jgi:transposase InsO family protein
MKVVHPGQKGEAVVATPTNLSPREPRMNVHKNARLTPQGRALLVRRIREEGWRVADAAAAAGISQRSAFRWLARHRAGGELALQDRSSAPARCPHRTDADTIAAIERLRRQRMTGPLIAAELQMPRSTVGVILRRLGLGRLSALDSKPPAIRYERDKPGELIHIDIKKLGRIDGIGHRITGNRVGQSNKRGTGWEYLHVAIDDASRLAYSEILPNERAESAIAFTLRALEWFARFGVRIERVMTDNGSAYRSFAYRDLLADKGIQHKRTRPYTPRTNGKAERFIQTSLREWAYANAYQTSAERTGALSPWISRYNNQRTHSGIGHRTPFDRLNNLLGFDN